MDKDTYERLAQEFHDCHAGSAYKPEQKDAWILIRYAQDDGGYKAFAEKLLEALTMFIEIQRKR